MKQMAKLSDIYPNLVGKKYCADCLYFALERKDGVVTGLHICVLPNSLRTYVSEYLTPCSSIKEKGED